MNASEFLDRLRHDSSAEKHAIGKPIDGSTPRPLHLPRDLFAFLAQTNGIRFWIDTDNSGYFSLLPIENIGTPVRIEMFGQEASAGLREAWPDQIVALSTHLDGKHFLALDTRDGSYIDADPIAGHRVIGRSMNEVLDWIWVHWIEDMRDDEAS